ncbi:MAG: diguanylate cyclase [Magnetococcales bacterium]|nr:diguanylate cyclase [Magnetococcales bacterium]
MQRGRRIFILIAFLVLVSIMTGAAMIGMLNWNMDQILHLSAEAVSRREKLVDFSKSLEKLTLEGQHAFDNLLRAEPDYSPKSDWLERYRTQTERALQRYGNKGDIKYVVEEIKLTIEVLATLWDQAITWHQTVIPIHQALLKRDLFFQVDDQINAMREAITSLNGQGRLKLVDQVILVRNHPDVQLEKSLINELFSHDRQEQLIRMASIQSDLEDLRRVIISLEAINDPDSLASLKDNQIRPLIVRLRREVTALADWQEHSALSLDFFERIVSSLFGEGYRHEEGYQTIQPGQGGLYLLKEQALRLGQQRIVLEQALSEIEKKLIQQIQGLSENTQLLLESVTREMAAEVLNSRSGLLTLAGIVGLIFLLLVVLIARLVREQVNRMVDSQQRIRAIMNTVSDTIITYDSQGRIDSINPSAQILFGENWSTLIGGHVHDLLSKKAGSSSLFFPSAPEVDTEHHENFHRTETWGKRDDGSHFPMEVTVSQRILTRENAGPNTWIYSAVLRDITRRHEEQEREVRSQVSRIAISALLETGLESLSLQRQLEVALDIVFSVSWLAVESRGVIFLVDEEKDVLIQTAQRNLGPQLITQCNRVPFGHCLCGRAAQDREIVFADHVDDRHDISFDGMMPHGHFCVPLMSKGVLLGVMGLYVTAGHVHKLEEDAFLTTVANSIAGLIEKRRMEEKLKRMEARLHRLAHFDALTGLPNRMMFQEYINRYVARARRDQTILALLFMDLDRFKYVNDTFGHDVGDHLLVEVSGRIKQCLRESDLVARLGGDEFTVLLPAITGKEDAGLVADKIIQSLCQPFHIQDNTFTIGSSIGICLFPKQGTTTEELVKRADIAMYEVKRNGKNHFRYYDPEMEEAAEV